MTATAKKRETLREYLVSQSIPYNSGRWFGRIPLSRIAQDQNFSLLAVREQLEALCDEGVLESLKIGGADGETAFFLVAA